MSYLAQEQAQSHRPVGDLWIETRTGETARQQLQFELFVRVSDKTVQVVELAP